MKLTLIRGLPGSGKSTMASKMGVSHFEADMYFMVDGEYRFDHKVIGLAHQWCQAETRKTLEKGLPAVVSHTFTKVWEMKPYLDMAQELGVEVEVLTATGEWQNTHGVPEEALARMRERWEAFP